MKPRATVDRFRIAERGDNRRPKWIVELPSRSTFWHLHIAIVGAIGDSSRLPEFLLKHSPLGRRVFVGVPLEVEIVDGPILDARKIRLREHFLAPGDSAVYYARPGQADGHAIVLESIALPVSTFARRPEPTGLL